MTSSISIECPKCNAKLKLKDESAVGRRLPCPGCKQPFVVQLRPSPPEDPLGDVANVLPTNVSVNDLRSGKPRASAWKKPALSAGGGFLGILLLAGLAWIVLGMFGGGRNGRLDLAYLPPDSEMVVSVRVADLWNAPVLRSLLQKPETKSRVQKMREQVGLVPADIESVVLGVAGLSDRQQEGIPMQNVAGNAMPNMANLPGIYVVRTTKAIDIAKLRNFVEKSEELPVNEIEQVSHLSDNYFRIPLPEGNGPEAVALFLPNDYTAVLGAEADVKLAIERGAESAVGLNFEFVNTNQHFLIAVVPEDRARFSKQVPNRQDSEATAKFQKTLQEAVQGFCFGLTLTDEIEMDFRFDCTDSSLAMALKADLDAVLDETLTEGRLKIADARQEAAPLSPVWREVLDLVEQVMDSIEGEQNRTVVAVHAVVPSSAGATLAKIPQAFSEAFSAGPVVSSDTGVDDHGDFSIPAVEPEPLTAVDLNEFRQSWQVDIVTSDQTAGDLIHKLSEELGIELEQAGTELASLKKLVSVKLSKVSRLQAIEEICRQVELVPVYSPPTNSFVPNPRTSLLSFKPGPRRTPVAFAGPFLVEVTAIHDQAPFPVGSLDLRIYAPGLPQDTLTAIRKFRANLNKMGVCEEVTNSQGEDLIDRSQLGGWSSFSGPSSVFDIQRSVSLKNLLQNVAVFKSVRGKIKFSLPTKINVASFDELTPDASRTFGDLVVTIKRANISSQYSSLNLSIEGAPDGFQLDDLKFEFIDSDGNTLKRAGGGGGGFGDNWSTSARARGEAASVTAMLVSQTEDVEYEFQLNDVPFEAHSKMPEVLAAPASFSGHAGPISLEFLKIAPDPDFPNFPPKARFRIVNHADKAIERLNMKFEYLDGNGKVLKEWPIASYAASMRQDGSVAVVEEKATAEFDANAPFMPIETKTVKATVKKVRFVDAEEWVSEEE